MKVESRYQIERVCSKDRTRHKLAEAYLLTIDGKRCLSASDGRMAVFVPAEAGEEERDGNIPTAALKIARLALNGKRQAVSSMLVSDDSVKLENGWVIPRQIQQDFPKFSTVIPDDRPTVYVSLNARLLYELALAMGDEAVTLGIRRETATVALNPIDVTPLGSNECYGVLMPMRTGEKPEPEFAKK